jgi:hypothetical protein
MHLAHLLNGLQFEDHLRLDDDVRPEALVKFHAFVFDRHRNLPDYRKAPSLQLLRQHGFVDRFKQAGTKC